MDITPTLCGLIWKNNCKHMQTILVTGGTSGIGLEIVKALLLEGCCVISTTRNAARSAELAKKLIQETNNNKLHFLEVDFADFVSVRRYADNVKDQFAKIDVLINNAGTWEMSFKETNDGVEINLQINHLSPMLLTLELLPLLDKSGDARIVNTSSGAHRRNIFDFDDMEWRNKPYDGVATYSQSKLFNLWFSLKLIDFLEGKNITVNTVHPGYVKTALFNNMGSRNWDGVANAANGARSALYAVLSSDVKQKSGLYLYHESPDPALSPLALDFNSAEKLWELSLQYISRYFSII